MKSIWPLFISVRSLTVLRIASADFLSMQTVEDSNCDFQPSLRRDVLAHLATTTFIPKVENLILFGPPGMGKTHLGIALGVKACQQGYPTFFDTVAGWVQRLTSAHQVGKLNDGLWRLNRYKLSIINEEGHLPFDAQAADLVFQLIAHRYEQGSEVGVVKYAVWTVG